MHATFQTEQEAKVLREKHHVTIVVVAVGPKLQRAELQSMASDPDCEYLSFVENFDGPELSGLAEFVDSKICGGRVPILNC